MEFEGRILRVLPTRSGTSSKGTEWKTLPFVFEYFESDDQRWSDKVFLETMDHDVMRAIGQFVERGADNKGIEENGSLKLKGEIKCRCGFSHSVREWEGKLFNQVRLYKFELVTGAATQPQPTEQIQQQMPPHYASQAPFPPQQPAPMEDSDDLPF